MTADLPHMILWKATATFRGLVKETFCSGLAIYSAQYRKHLTEPMKIIKTKENLHIY